jgi:hypothetical protein
MNRRIPLAASVAGGGMLAAAFLSTGVAVADTGDNDTDNGNGVSDNAFTTHDGLTFDPVNSDGEAGYNDVSPLFGVAPLLQIGGGSLGGNDIASQDFDIYEDGDQIGTATAGVNTSNILGIQTAQFTLDDVNPVENPVDNDASTDDISAVLGSGDIFGPSGLGLDDSDFTGGGLDDAVSALHGDDSTDVLANDVSASDVTSALDSAGLSLSDDSDFSAGDIADALNGVDTPTSDQLADVLQGAGLSDSDVDGDGTVANVANEIHGFPDVAQLGDDVTGSDVTDALSNVGGASVSDDVADQIADALNNANNGADLPDDGTVYSLTNFGFGFENVYEAIPNDDGDAAANIQDTLITPFGNFDLSTPFDAIANLMPGDAAGGVDASGNGGGGLFGGLFGGSGGGEGTGGGVETDASTSDIQSALSSSSADFSDGDFSGDDSSVSDVASALADSDATDQLGDTVSGSDVTSALNDANISISGSADFNAGDIASALNDATVNTGEETGNGTSDGLFGGLLGGLGGLF